MSRQISRDPFARTTLMRDTVAKPSSSGCDWCGGFSRSGGLFRYSTERDGVSRSYVGPHAHKGLFCSKSCFNSYHR